MSENRTIIKPQPGPQTTFLSTSADVAIYGGAAGGGKSFALLIDPLRYVSHPRFGAVIFRRTHPEIKGEGGLWDEATSLYVPLGAKSKETDLTFTFKSGGSVRFAHMLYEKDKHNWQGSQIPYVGFDELTHFSEGQFWYLLSRQRNVHGLPNLCRATCNPDPDSFVRKLIDWYIGDDGLPIKERSGQIRWYVRIQGELIWADDPRKLTRRYADKTPRSFTFISAKLTDNKILMQNDPGYQDILESLPRVDRLRLKYGNWNTRPSPSMYFKRHYFQIVDRAEVPQMQKTCRGWDLAASEKVESKSLSKQPAATAGVLLGRGTDGVYYLLDVVRERVTPKNVERLVKNKAIQDGIETIVRLPQDPGQAGKSQIANFANLLAGFVFKARTMTGDKVTRAGALSSAAENGLIKVVKGPWNDMFFEAAEEFPPEVGSPDIIDAAVEAFHEITLYQNKTWVVSPVTISYDDMGDSSML